MLCGKQKKYVKKVLKSKKYLHIISMQASTSERHQRTQCYLEYFLQRKVFIINAKIIYDLSENIKYKFRGDRSKTGLYATDFKEDGENQPEDAFLKTWGQHNISSSFQRNLHYFLSKIIRQS